ncbi:MAG: ornithine cyclodeaminase family protein [Mesorhizobium sp.]|uniref:ornithine cyclodeaminase family protein n=1 Tax=Mesorhizobium sp. TaxID=1871066 RepID=UPI000FE5B106|nr:ornithine cyclodeaminase family protein [Mesorhizobium sp.]RWE15272.1 MAG: ornithine cyclodeaminase family protein [Mesorhizobium sp.]
MPAQPDGHLLYLSRADVSALGIEALELVNEVAACFSAKAEGLARSTSTLSIPMSGGARFVAKGGIIGSPPNCAIKWFGYFPANAKLGIPDYHPLLIVSEATKGMPLAVIDGTWISEVRTAAISAFAARHLANAQSASIGFVACGAQAYAHLELFRQLFPLVRIHAYSRRKETAEKFCTHATKVGLRAELCDTPRPVVEHSDIIITSVPHTAQPTHQLRGDWMSLGAFASMVDRGNSWDRASLSCIDTVITDDLALSGPQGEGGINFEPKRLAGDLGDVSLGRVQYSSHGQAAIIFSGAGIVDAAIGALVYQRARATGKGVLLPL